MQDPPENPRPHDLLRRREQVADVAEGCGDDRVVLGDAQQPLHVGTRDPQHQRAVALDLGQRQVAADRQVPGRADDLPGRAEVLRESLVAALQAAQRPSSIASSAAIDIP